MSVPFGQAMDAGPEIRIEERAGPLDPPATWNLEMMVQLDPANQAETCGSGIFHLN